MTTYEVGTKMDKLKIFWQKVRTVMKAENFNRYPVLHDKEEIRKQRNIAALKRTYKK